MQPSDYTAIADRFGAVVDAVTDWDAPTPVPEWVARDIVHHLTTWLPGLLGSCGVQLSPISPVERSAATTDAARTDVARTDAARTDADAVVVVAADRADPVGSWRRQDAAMRRLLIERGDEEVTHPFLGSTSIAGLLAQVYIGDVFMHTWDLSRSAGVPHGLDPTLCEEMLVSVRAMEDALRASGHFGPAWPHEPPPSADSAARLMAFVGRDPSWAPPRT